MAPFHRVEPDPLVLTSADSWVSEGRQFFSFEGVKGLNPRLLPCSVVVIDGERWRVYGAETFALIDPTGCEFSLCVKKDEA